MMKRFTKSLMLLLAVAACSPLEDLDEPGIKRDLTFQATTSTWTKTNLEEDGKVLWTEKDEISIFSSSDLQSNECFRLQDRQGQTARFSGKASKGRSYYAIYPYSSVNKVDGQLLKLSIPQEQEAVAGSFQERNCPMAAKSDDQQIQFQNITSLIAFEMPPVGDEEIVQAILKGNQKEELSGPVRVDLGPSSIKMETTASSYSKVTLTGKLESGQTYYMATIPQTFKEGVTLTLYNSKGLGTTLECPSPFETKAGSIHLLSGFDITTESDIRKEGNLYHIYTAKGLLRFAALVNAGETNADALLENDIDLEESDCWEPIGKATVRYEKIDNRTNTALITGTAYSGTFDGNGKTIFNLKMKADGDIMGNASGFFGILDNASIKNLTLGKAGDHSQFQISTSGSSLQETGVLAGLCHESNITDVTNHIHVTYDGSSTQRVTIGIIGCVHSDKKQSILERVVNRADFNIAGSGNDSNRWATAIHVGGICGAAFSAYESGNHSSNKITFLSYCENYGNITSNSGRVAGIAGAAPYYAVLNSCFNHGTIQTSNPVSGYAAGMSVYMSTMSGMQDCINDGDVIATNGAGVAGLVGMCSYDNSNFSACANFGDIISDNTKRGVFVSTNSARSRWMGCTAAGHVGTYNNHSFRYDSYPEDKQIQYLGPGAENLNLDGIIWQMGSSELPEGPEAELRILFIGNSFTQDAVHLLPNLLEGAGIKTVELGLMYWGGSTIQQHDTNFYTNSTNFTYYRKPTSVDGSWMQYKGYTIEDAIKEHEWDIITIQEHTGRAQSWIWDKAEKDAINGLISKILETQKTKTPEIWYLFTQAYHDLSKSSATRDSFKSTEEHYTKIAAQAQKIQQEITTLKGIIPTGTVLQNLRGSSLNNQLGLTRDGYHMDYGLSRYAASCAVYELLVKDRFPDKSLETNTWRTSDSGAGQTPVTDENRPLALLAARKAIVNPFEMSSLQ